MAYGDFAPLGSLSSGFSPGGYFPTPLGDLLRYGPPQAPVDLVKEALIIGRKGGLRLFPQELQQAEQMMAKGAPAEDIRGVTGWEQGSKINPGWMRELPLDDLKVHGYGAGGSLPADAALSGGAMQDVWKAYPEMRNMQVQSGQGPVGGAMIFTGYPGMPQTVTRRIEAFAPTREAVKPVMSHELEHGVSQLEGWSMGSQPAAHDASKAGTHANKILDAMAHDQAQQVLGVDNGAAFNKLVEKFRKSPKLRGDAEFMAYESNTAEVRSRLAAKRDFGMGPDAAQLRKDRPLILDEDMPLSFQWFRKHPF